MSPVRTLVLMAENESVMQSWCVFACLSRCVSKRKNQTKINRIATLRRAIANALGRQMVCYLLRCVFSSSDLVILNVVVWPQAAPASRGMRLRSAASSTTSTNPLDAPLSPRSHSINIPSSSLSSSSSGNVSPAAASSLLIDASALRVDSLGRVDAAQLLDVTCFCCLFLCFRLSSTFVHFFYQLLRHRSPANEKCADWYVVDFGRNIVRSLIDSANAAAGRRPTGPRSRWAFCSASTAVACIVALACM